jgi:hypothetical protein
MFRTQHSARRKGRPGASLQSGPDTVENVTFCAICDQIWTGCNWTKPDQKEPRVLLSRFPTPPLSVANPTLVGC